MAYATVSGLPVSVGLYTAFVPMIVYALLGTSRVLSVRSTTTLAILAGTQLGTVVPDGDPAKLITAVATLGNGLKRQVAQEYLSGAFSRQIAGLTLYQSKMTARLDAFVVERSREEQIKHPWLAIGNPRQPFATGKRLTIQMITFAPASRISRMPISFPPLDHFSANPSPSGFAGLPASSSA
jgi:hypothetical protein